MFINTCFKKKKENKHATNFKNKQKKNKFTLHELQINKNTKKYYKNTSNNAIIHIT